MQIQVGGSLKRNLGQKMFDAAAHWPVCELIPENWDPDNPEDVEILKSLSRDTQFLLHSLSLNALGEMHSDFLTQRILAWGDILETYLVTDHFSWSATDDHSFGVSIPPFEEAGVLSRRVSALKKKLGRQLGLENICLSADDEGFCHRYHQTLTQICKEEGVLILLDLENLRLDSVASGAPVQELLAYYADSEIAFYHVAGSTECDLVLDTHDQPVPDQTLQLLLQSYRRNPKAVIYERDYALDIADIIQEVEKISCFLQQGN
jgi:uncharacterized protein (UPF0276 family)